MYITVTDTTLLTPSGGIASNVPIKIICTQGFDQVLTGSVSEFTTESDGSYDFPLYYGTHVIMVRWENTYAKLGKVAITSELADTATISDLLLYTEPMLPAEIIIVAALVAEANDAANAAGTSEANAEVSALASAASAASAAEISGIDDIYGAIALLQTDVAFEATFNDSANISKGYGTHDTITAGGDTVDLPSKSVDFTCASERTVLNKSGVTEDVAVDSPAIGSGGIWCHGAYTNIVLQSADMVASPWSVSQGGAASLSSELSSNGVDYLYLCESTTTDTGRITQTVSADFTNGLSRSFEIKNNNATTTLVSVQGGGISKTVSLSIAWSGNEISSFSAINCSYEALDLGGGIYRIYMSSSEDLGLVTSSGAIVFPSGFGTSEASGVYIGNNMITEKGTPLPYIKTEASQVSVAKTTLSVSANGNLPAAGQPFAIEVDCSIPLPDNDSVVFRQDRTINTGLLFRRLSSGVIQFGIAADGDTKTASYQGDYGRHKYVCKYNGAGNIYLYEDGLQVATNTTNTPTYDLNVPLNVGNDSLYSLNGQIKNFRIHHGLVSGETIKSWGGAK